MTEPRPDWEALRRLFANPVAAPAAATATMPATAPVAGGTWKDPTDALDAAEERAAIMEYDGGLSRDEAEAIAYREFGVPRPARS